MKACSVFVLVVLAVIAGLALGLLIGWVVWPVQWINASPEEMRREFQVDWVNMAIDSYSVNQNAQLAAQRFTYLGQDGPTDLEYVLNNPQWVSPADAQAYAEAVTQQLGAEAVTVTPSTTQTQSLGSRLLRQPLFGYVVVILFLALLAIVLLVILVIRLMNRGKKEPVPETVAPVPPEGTSEVLPVESPTVEAAVITEPEEARLSTGELVAAGVVAAGVAAAAEPTEETEATGIEEAASFEEVAAAEAAEQELEAPSAPAEEAPEHEVGTAAKVLATGAAVAGIASSLTGSEEEKEAEVAPIETAGVVSAVEEVAGVKPEFEGVVDTVEGAIEDTKPVATAAGAGAAIAGVEWALEKQPEAEKVEPEEVLFAPIEPATEETEPEAPPAELGQDYLGKYNRKVIEIEGVGEAYANRLAEAGITTTHALLQQCATTKGRDELAQKTGISGKLILEWANHADMMRVQGIGPQWSDLLEMAGVNTVRELALRNPANLYQKLVEINEKKKLVRKLPTEDQLEDWIEQAKDLPRILTY